jgi:hypothetical protein
MPKENPCGVHSRSLHTPMGQATHPIAECSPKLVKATVGLPHFNTLYALPNHHATADATS